MLYEYAVEPKAIGSDWQTFRYLIEKFGFDRGRLISQFPKAWLKEVYESTQSLKPLERKRIEECLARAKQTKLIRSGRPYDPQLGGWLPNAVAQQRSTPFRAIIASEGIEGEASVLVASELDENAALMDAPLTWQVARTGIDLANSLRPLLLSARTLLFVDPYFSVQMQRYQETLKACLEVVHAGGGKSARCEVHYGLQQTRLSFADLSHGAPNWLRGVIPNGMSVVLFAWNQKVGGEDFHVRNLLTDVGGVNVEAGFSAEGRRQQVQMSLLPTDFTHRQMQNYVQASTVYDLAHPVLEVFADGSARQL